MTDDGFSFVDGFDDDEDDHCIGGPETRILVLCRACTQV